MTHHIPSSCIVPWYMLIIQLIHHWPVAHDNNITPPFCINLFTLLLTLPWTMGSQTQTPINFLKPLLPFLLWIWFSWLTVLLVYMASLPII